MTIYSWQNDWNIDSLESRESMKAIHLLARHGARWKPEDKSEMKSCRRSLLKLAPPYALEFAWILAGYKLGSREDLIELFRTEAMRKHTARFCRKLSDIVATASE